MKHAPKRDYTLPVEGEPDIVKGYYDGIAYRIIRHPSMGHLCGYAKLPIGHPWLKKARAPRWKNKWFSGKYHRTVVGYDAVQSDVRVHGGLTFFGKLSRGRGHWIGFDCAHCDDLVPAMEKLMPTIRMEWATYRTVDFARLHCMRLAKAIAAAAK